MQLTPLEQTVAGQELIQIGREEGITKGELIGDIRMAQRILRHPIASEKELAQKNLEELNMILQQLDSELNYTDRT